MGTCHMYIAENNQSHVSAETYRIGRKRQTRAETFMNGSLKSAMTPGALFHNKYDDLVDNSSLHLFYLGIWTHQQRCFSTVATKFSVCWYNNAVQGMTG